MRDLYMLDYHLPQEMENLRRKMGKLEGRARLVGDDKALAKLSAANAAWNHIKALENSSGVPG